MVDLLLNDFGTNTLIIWLDILIRYKVLVFSEIQRLFDLFVGKGADLTVYYHNGTFYNWPAILDHLKLLKTS